MKKNHLINRLTPAALCFVISFALIFSCTGKREEIKNPSFEKWRVKAEKSKAYSPAAAPHMAKQPAAAPASALSAPAAAAPKKTLPTRKISLKMTNVDVAVLLRALARAADLNIIVGQRVTGKLDINITQAPWDQVFLGILRTQNLGYTWEGDILRIMTADDIAADLRRKAQQKDIQLAAAPLTRIVPIQYASADQLRDNLEKFLTSNKEGQPIGSILVDEHTNSLIIQAIRSDMQAIMAVIDKLDRPTPQVLIEAQIVEASKDVARELGIQWGGLGRGKSGRNTFFATGRDNSSLGGNVGTPVDPTSGLVVDFPANALSGINPMTLGVIYQNVGNVLLSAQLSALQDEGKLNILSSPSITTLDNTVATIESGSDIPFQSVEDGEVKIEYKKAVLSLKVTPHVIDAKTLKLYIKVHKDEPDFSQTVLGNPTIRTKNAETNVIQFDGQTIVIGGLNKQTESRNESGVPLLKDVPGLGYLFRQNSKANQLEDLLIFITPHILQPRPVASQ